MQFQVQRQDEHGQWQLMASHGDLSFARSLLTDDHRRIFDTHSNKYITRQEALVEEVKQGLIQLGMPSLDAADFVRDNEDLLKSKIDGGVSVEAVVSYLAEFLGATPGGIACKFE